jgi:hypothetical protein
MPSVLVTKLYCPGESVMEKTRATSWPGQSLVVVSSQDVTDLGLRVSYGPADQLTTSL